MLSLAVVVVGVVVTVVVVGAVVVETAGSGPSIWASTYARKPIPRRRPRRR